MTMKLKKLYQSIDSVNDIFLLFEIYAFITILPILTRFLSLEKLMKLLTPANEKMNNTKISESQIEKTVKFTDFILNRNFWIYKKLCIKRALTLYYFLRKKRFEVQVFYGVKKLDVKYDDEITGHAWLVHKGKMFAENDHNSTNDFTVTYVYPT